jgi:hypothetical protein
MGQQIQNEARQYLPAANHALALAYFETAFGIGPFGGL